MNEGRDEAQSAADVVLMRPDLSGLLAMRNASKASVRRIKLNLAWSFVYNLFAVLLAAGAFVNARIPPQFAGLGNSSALCQLLQLRFSCDGPEFSLVCALMHP